MLEVEEFSSLKGRNLKKKKKKKRPSRGEFFGGKFQTKFEEQLTR